MDFAFLLFEIKQVFAGSEQQVRTRSVQERSFTHPSPGEFLATCSRDNLRIVARGRGQQTAATGGGSKRRRRRPKRQGKKGDREGGSGAASKKIHIDSYQRHINLTWEYEKKRARGALMY